MQFCAFKKNKNKIMEHFFLYEFKFSTPLFRAEHCWSVFLKRLRVNWATFEIIVTFHLGGKKNCCKHEKKTCDPLFCLKQKKMQSFFFRFYFVCEH